MNPLSKLLILLSVIFLSTVAVVSYRFYSKNKSSFESNPMIPVPSGLVSATDIPQNFQKLHVIYSTADSNSSETYENIRYVCSMGKINAEFTPVLQFTAQILDRAGADDSVVIATEMVESLPAGALYSYVQNGGHLVFLTRNTASVFHQLVGIESSRGYLPAIKGLLFKQPFFPGMDSLKLQDSGAIVHSSVDVRCARDVLMYAESSTGVPLLWTRKYGNGNVVYLNSTLANYKGNRGFLLQVIALGSDYFLQTVVNTKVLTIDDFPAPIKRGRDNIIHNYYLMDNLSFFRHIWWSSMYSLAKKYNLVYTGMLIGTYNLTVSPPFDQMTLEEIDDLRYFGYKLLELKGEIGFHGYNHNSLVMKDQMLFDEYGYYPWPSKEAMENALNITNNSVRSVFSQLKITSYVPPSNIISVEGKQAVLSVFPGLRVIGGLYTGSDEKGILYQEFGPDPDLEGVYDYPRLSAGYTYSSEDMWTIFNGIAHFGLVNHFIHPDDVLDSNRSGDKTWKDLYSDIDKIFGEIHAHFPHLRPRTVTHAAEEYRFYEKLRVFVHREKDTVAINYTDAALPVFHYFRLNIKKRIVSINGGVFHYINDTDTYRLYLIIANSASVTLKFESYD